MFEMKRLLRFARNDTRHLTYDGPLVPFLKKKMSLFVIPAKLVLESHRRAEIQHERCDILLCEVSVQPSQPLRRSRLATKHEFRTTEFTAIPPKSIPIQCITARVSGGL